jgi:hypothetical protein
VPNWDLLVLEPQKVIQLDKICKDLQLKGETSDFFPLAAQIQAIFRKLKFINNIHLKRSKILMRNCLSNTGSTFRNLGIVTYYIVSYDKKAVCPNLFAALPNIFYYQNLPFHLLRSL